MRSKYVLVLDAPLALVVDEAAAAAGAPLAAEVGLLGVAAGFILADAASNAEQHGCNQVACKCSPCEAVCVGADLGRLAGGAESVASDDSPCSALC